MRLAAAITASVVLVLLIVSVGLLSSQVSTLRTQVQTQSRQDSPTHQQAEIAKLQTQLGAVRTSVNGEHRDLITCGDLSDLGLEYLNDVNLSTDASGNISASPDQTPIALPQHCINN